MSTSAIRGAFWAVATGLKAATSAARTAPLAKMANTFFIALIITSKTNAKLELPAPAILRMMQWDTVIQAERTESRNIQADSDTVIVRIFRKVIVVRP